MREARKPDGGCLFSSASQPTKDRHENQSGEPPWCGEFEIAKGERHVARAPCTNAAATRSSSLFSSDRALTRANFSRSQRSRNVASKTRSSLVNWPDCEMLARNSGEVCCVAFRSYCPLT